MKILHLISSGGMYGAEAVILNLSHTLNETSHSSVVGVFANSTNLNMEFYERASSEGLETQLIPCSGQMDRSAITTLRKLALSTGADIVHAHGFKADIYAWLALRSTGIPLVSTCHTWYDHDAKVTFYGRLDRFVLRRYAAVVSVSNAVTERLLGAGVRLDKVHIIGNGIDMRPFEGTNRSIRDLNENQCPPIIGVVARLSHEKGIDLFLHAAQRVLKEIPTARFIVVGDGPERERLESLIQELGLGDSVSLVGRREDMPSVYASFDLQVSASRHEGLPMAILEGMASGLPCVATAVGDVPKIIRDGDCGFLVASGDIESLSARVIALLRDPALRRQLGDAAQRRVEEEFSAHRMATKYLNVYRRVLADRHGTVSHGVNKSAFEGKPE
jgi:glycosyltransferase involved in cell wall biosynthesis